MAEKSRPPNDSQLESSPTSPPKSARAEREPGPEPWIPFDTSRSLLIGCVFYCHQIAAFQHPIQDCDEVFNYWDPTHYLTHGHAFQTWEYAPAYAIRSWAYAGLHALVTSAGKALLFLSRKLFSSTALSAMFVEGDKTYEFYLLRAVLASVCMLCELRLSNSITQALDEEIGVMFVLVVILSPGMWHASVAYLPSTFTMYTTMLGMAAFMDSSGGKRTAQGIFAIGVGAVLGWPFAAAMAMPFLLYELALAVRGSKQDRIDLFWHVTYGTLGTLLVLTVQVAIDSYYYGKPVVVPFNIISYNIFSQTGGPDLYGTEPWHFYLRNLFLNFHIWFIFALLSMPILFAQHLWLAEDEPKPTLRQAVFLTPFYLWLAIFTLQPHKEERFMYPAYPALILNASQAFHITFEILTTNLLHHTLSKIPLKPRLYAVTVFSLGAGALGILRVAGTINAFHAPLQIYAPLHTTPGLAAPGDTVCLGKEWYRFPSHFLLPTDIHAKFLKSEFAGLLPGEFPSHPSIEPRGMNDENREDMGKYTPLRNCTFLVDVQLPSTVPTELEPGFVSDAERWERVKCLPFLDAASTGLVARLVYIPDWEFVPRRFRRVYGEYCLLRRRKVVGKLKGDPVPHIETLG